MYAMEQSNKIVLMKQTFAKATTAPVNKKKEESSLGMNINS